MPYSGVFRNRYTARKAKRKGTVHAAKTGGNIPVYPIDREKV